MSPTSYVMIDEALGWAACLMTLVTFAQRDMLWLRLAAILANLFFIGYGAIGHFLPVLALHLVLLPLNVARVRHALKLQASGDRGNSGPAHPPAPLRHSSAVPMTDGCVICSILSLP